MPRTISGPFVPVSVELAGLYGVPVEAIGKIYAAEIITTAFAGPPLGALLFAVGVAVGLTENSGVAALTAVVGYQILAKLNGLGSLWDVLNKVETPAKVNMSVFGGIAIGFVAAWAFNKYKDVRLPSYLGFFAGRRFVPIVGSFYALVVGLVAGFVWPPIGSVLDKFGVWIVKTPDDLVARAGGFYALLVTCTHLGCTPNYLSAEAKFKCPCHGSGFYKDGVNFEGPAPRPLERYAVRIADDGQLEIDKSRAFQEELGQWADPDSFIQV